MNLSKKILAGAIAAFAVASAQAGTIFIDDFSDAQDFTTASSATDSTALTSNVGIATNRQVDLTASGSQVRFQTKACTGSAVSCGSFAADPGITGTMDITWNLGGADLTDGGVNDAILLNYNFIDFPGTVAITATSGATVSTFAAVATPFLISGFPGSNQNYDFSSFSNAGVFSSVDTLSLSFTFATAATDMELNFIDAVDNDPPASVPNPAPLALFGFGLIGAWVARKRQL